MNSSYVRGGYLRVQTYRFGCKCQRTYPKDMRTEHVLPSQAMPAAANVRTFEAAEGVPARRKECIRCLRPQRVCLCQALPVRLLRLRGHVLILQHPHELKQRLATVPLLRCCLDEESLSIATGRKLQQPGSNPIVDALLGGAQNGEYPLYLLFPGPDARDLTELTLSEAHGVALQRAAARLEPAVKASQQQAEHSKKHSIPPIVHPQQALQATRPSDYDQPAANITGAVNQCTSHPDAEACTRSADRSQNGSGLKVPELCIPSGVADIVKQRPDANKEAGNDLKGAADTGSCMAGQRVLPVTGARRTAGEEGSSGSFAKVDSFPSSEDVTAADSQGGYAAFNQAQSRDMALPAPAYLLLVIDGTWRQAREMYRAVASRCLPPAGSAIQVALTLSDMLPLSAVPQRPGSQPDANGQPAAARPHSTSPKDQSACFFSETECAMPTPSVTAQDCNTSESGRGVSPLVGQQQDFQRVQGSLDYDPDMPCLIRKEPVAGFVTTYEATARALGLLEQDPALAATLLEPLRLMTRLQAAYSPSVLSRMRGETAKRN